MSSLRDRLLCAAQGECGPFDPDNESGWTARLLREAADALSDTERLDWLEAQANEPDGLHLHDGQPHRYQCRGLGLRPGTLVRTLREAIDSGMPT